MQTKSSTKKARKGSAPTKAEQRAQLARTLSAILRNPETPCFITESQMPYATSPKALTFILLK